MKKWLFLSIFYLTALLVHADPLPADDVFQLHAKKIDPNTFAITWQIEQGYFLYSDRISLATAPDSNIHLGALRFPVPLTKTDKQGRSFKVYRNELTLPVSILGENPGETLLTLCYQGCSDDGFCYPPEEKQIKLSIDNKLALSDVTIEDAPQAPQSAQAENEASLDHIFAEHSWLVTLLLFYGFGLLLSFTPCILPMVPVLSGIIVGHEKDINTKKAFFLSLSYVLSMSVTYAFAGALVALLGANIQISMQNPWAITLFSFIFVALALSMFGFYEFKLPDSWQQKIAGSSRKQRGGHYWGAAIMGSLSTLILSPCVTAPLIGVLSYIAKTGNVAFGSITLFILSLGMGTPLLLIGTSAGRWLPEAGSWMDTLKASFGILFLAIAIYLMGRILPNDISMALWSILLIFSGIYAGALTYAPNNTDKFYQGIGIILLGYGLLILVGASMGETNPLQPLASLRTASAATTVNPIKVNTLGKLQSAIISAKGQPIMLDFYADWCASCKAMEVTTFKDALVEEALSHFTVIKVDLTDNNAEEKEVMRHFNVIAPPTFVFFDSQGQELKNLQLVGEIGPKEFLENLRKV